MIAVAWKERRVTRTFLNVLLEQCLVSPVLFAVCWDIPLPALLWGTPPWRQLPTEVQSKLGPLLTLVNLVTYYNIPVQYRVLFASCADIAWQSINASITSQEVRPAHQ